MDAVNIHEAKTHLSKLIERVARGEEIIIANAGRPVARLVPLPPRVDRREPGTARDIIHVAQDFDQPLPEELLGRFS